jgi:hypothetical protein
MLIIREGRRNDAHAAYRSMGISFVQTPVSARSRAIS